MALVLSWNFYFSVFSILYLLFLKTVLSQPFRKLFSPGIFALFYITLIIVCIYICTQARTQCMEWWDVHFSQFLHIILLELHYKEQRVWLWACPHTKENCILTTSKLLWIWMSPVFFWRVYCFLLLQKIAFSSCWLWS